VVPGDLRPRHGALVAMLGRDVVDGGVYEAVREQHGVGAEDVTVGQLHLSLVLEVVGVGILDLVGVVVGDYLITFALIGFRSRSRTGEAGEEKEEDRYS